MSEKNPEVNEPGLGSTAKAVSEVCRPGPGNTLISPPCVLARGAHDSAQDFLAKLEKLLRGPQQQHCALEVCAAVRAGIEQVIRLLHKPSEQLYRWMEAAEILAHHLQSKLGDTHESSRQNLKGKKTKHPVWVCYAQYGLEKPLNCATQILLGCAAILAFDENKVISRSMPGKLADLEALGPIDEQQFLALMAGIDYEEAGGNESIDLLKRLWQNVLRRFSPGQELPVSAPGEKIRSQVVSSALNTSARHVAGAAHHRQLTMEQFEQACERMNADLAKPLLGEQT